jgi:hypothetical protein
MRQMLMAAALVACASPVFAQPAPAISASKAAAIREYMAITDPAKMVNDMAEAAAKPTIEALSQRMAAQGIQLSANKQQQIRRLFVEEMQILAPDVIKWTENSTAQVFTEAEIRAITAFYKTAEGQSMLRKMPQLQASIQGPLMQAMQGRMPMIAQKLQVILSMPDSANK